MSLQRAHLGCDELNMRTFISVIQPPLSDKKIFFCLAHVLPNITKERLVSYTAIYQQGAVYMFWLHFELSLVDRDWQRVF